MIQDKYLWERPFRLRILASCLHKDWFSSVGVAVVKPEYFDTVEEQNLLRFLSNFYVEQHRAPQPDEMRASFVEHDELMADLIDEVVDILGNKADELNYAKTQAVKFAKTQASRWALLEIDKLIDQGDFEKCLTVLAKAVKTGDDATDMGIDLIDDIDQWIHPRYDNDERISTGIVHLDQALKGGLGRGEYGLLLAPTNGGKTTTLINIGFGAASLVSKANVLHIAINEMSAKDIAENYGSRITGMPYDLALEDLNAYVDKFDDSVLLKVRGRIRIKEFTRLSIEQLAAYIDSLEYIKFKPDLLIVDYADLITVDPRREYRFELGRIARELRALGKDHNMAVWSASQVQRTANRKELIGVDSIAESYDKATVADVILSINMTNEEKESGISRLYCDKTRVKRTKSKWIVQCVHNLDSYALESTRFMTYSEWLEEKSDNESKQLQIIK